MENFLDVSSELVVVFRGSVEDESDVYVLGVFLWYTVEVSFG